MKRLLLFSTILFCWSFSKAQTNFIHQDSVFTQSSDCTGGVKVCVDSFSYALLDDYKFSLDGQVYADNSGFSPCTSLHNYSYSYTGTFQGRDTFSIDAWSVDGQSFKFFKFTSLNQMVDSMRKWDPSADWRIEPTAELIYSTQKARTYSPIVISGQLIGVTDIIVNTGLLFKVPTGIHKFVAENRNTGDKDTVTIGAACVSTQTIKDTMYLGVNRAHCLDFSQLLGTPKLSTFSNFCSRATSNVTFDSLYNFCISYTARSAGSDTACMRVCDQYGICDTTYLYITAQKSTFRQHYINDTLTVGLSRKKSDFAAPVTGVKTFRNLCPTRSGTSIDFVIDSVGRSVTYTAKAIGFDTACIQVCDSSGLCDTTFLYVEGLKIIPVGGKYFVTDTILVDSIKTRCDITKPSGTISLIENYCAGISNNEVQFSVENTLKCISYRGLKAGVDTACIRVCNTDGTCDTTIFYVTTKSNPLTTSGGSYVYSDTISIGSSRKKCELTTPIGTINTFKNICLSSSGSHVVFTLDTVNRCVTYVGTSLGVDTACILVCNTGNMCDTTKMIVEAKIVPNTSTSRQYFFSDTITINTVRTKVDFKLPLGANNITNYCTSSSNNNVLFTINSATLSVTYQGKKVGIDTACIRICNVFNVCDTTTMYIQSKAAIISNPTLSIDSISIKIGELKVYCPDSTQLQNGTITDIVTCNSASAVHASMKLNAVTKCAEFRGISEGKDTACLVLLNSAGLKDTTILYIKVAKDTVKPVLSTDTVIVKIGETVVFNKIDTTQIMGSVDTIYDACPGNNGTSALMVLSRSNRNVTITGNNVGTDKMCIVVFNRTSKLYDTTIIVARVIDTARIQPIIAVNDYDTVKLGRSVDLKVYANDTLRGRVPTFLEIFEAPLKGTADTISFRNGIIKYTASRSPYSCGQDSFKYRVCIDTVCSIATVIIEVACNDTLRAYNGISPNGDSRNDAFVIEGLQKYPNNTLLIYNRWGNEVLNVKNYQNDWQGTWKNKDLPDATYFYMLRDDDTGEVLMTGYLQIMR